MASYLCGESWLFEGFVRHETIESGLVLDGYAAVRMDNFSTAWSRGAVAYLVRSRPVYRACWRGGMLENESWSDG